LSRKVEWVEACSASDPIAVAFGRPASAPWSPRARDAGGEPARPSARGGDLPSTSNRCIATTRVI